ncbi:XRE family transcriptional regulator [Peptoniphilus sp. KCTC 25270]|uniref:helix-turn-helix domain-containing protein n=1 Tax=Peptoniphilus sp. KCTC 25270 TaxID=2897414 RepID=UPI001E2FBE49|nr:XRE family transcriptional regulator [Peptoniphilus sp. KCTC 25270]MCD1148026.1 XRE family transcriptional regulator [Peptoniphilus sp. KCTC 25270]
MDIGSRIRLLRQQQNLTQEELAERCELTKGFISQIERNLTSPSITTFLYILEALGTNPENFFKNTQVEQRVFHEEDFFEAENEELGYLLSYIVPNAQKNEMEPTLWEIQPGGETKILGPFEGESFAYIFSGQVEFHFGKEVEMVKKNQTIYSTGEEPQFFRNKGKSVAKVLWVCSPPSF